MGGEVRALMTKVMTMMDAPHALGTPVPASAEWRNSRSVSMGSVKKPNHPLPCWAAAAASASAASASPGSTSAARADDVDAGAGAAGEGRTNAVAAGDAVRARRRAAARIVVVGRRYASHVGR